MKILMLSSSFPRYEGDYFGPWVLEYIRELRRQGHSVILVAPVTSNNEINLLSEEGIRIERFNYFFPRLWQKLVYPPGIIPQIKKNPLKLFQVPFLLHFFYRKVKEVLKNNEIDIIHSQWVIPSGYIGSLLSEKHRIPHVITSQGAEFFLSPNHPFSFFTKKALQKCDYLFPVSQQMGERALEFGIAKEKIKIIPNTVNTTIFCPDITSNFRQKHQIPLDATVILTIRRLVHEKRVEDVIESFAQLKNANTFLVIGGDGPDRSKLETLCKKLKVKDKVIFLGFVNNEDLPPIYVASDIYVLSSEQEGLSLSLLESMSSGVITISTTGTGGNEVIEHGKNGFLFGVGEVEKLKVLLDEIMGLNTFEIKKIQKLGRETIITKFSVNNMVNQWNLTYQQLLNEDHKRSFKL